MLDIDRLVAYERKSTIGLNLSMCTDEEIENINLESVEIKSPTLHFRLSPNNSGLRCREILNPFLTEEIEKIVKWGETNAEIFAVSDMKVDLSGLNITGCRRLLRTDRNGIKWCRIQFDKYDGDAFRIFHRRHFVFHSYLSLAENANDADEVFEIIDIANEIIHSIAANSAGVRLSEIKDRLLSLSNLIGCPDTR